MSFVTRGLSVLNYANGFTYWHYRSTGPVNDVLRPNFFHGAVGVSPGDMILVSACDGGAQIYVQRADLNSVHVSVMMCAVPSLVEAV